MSPGLGMIHFVSELLGGDGMRGSDSRSGALFCYVDLETRNRRDHPLRSIRRMGRWRR